MNMASETALVPRMPDMPLMSADEAKKAWESYQELRDTLLQEEDYMWFLEFQETPRGGGRPHLRRYTYCNRAEAAEAQKTRAGSTIHKRMVKSACRKMAKFFGYEISDVGMGQVERSMEGDFVVVTERGEGYVHTEWLNPTDLKTIKASSTVAIRSPNGRTWVSKGGAHQTEGQWGLTTRYARNL